MVDQFRNIRVLMQRPHPVEFGRASVYLPGFIVFVLLITLSPFGFEELVLEDRIFMAISFGVITTAGVMFNYLCLKTVLPNLFKEGKWKIKNELIYGMYDVLVIGFLNTLFVSIFELSERSFLDILVEVEEHTLLIGIVPVVLLIAIEQGIDANAQLVRMQQINEELQQNLLKHPSENPILFHSENGQVENQLMAEEILFLKSDGNYVDIFTENPNGPPRKHLIRNRISQVYQELPDNVFFHCHRSYIVNALKVKDIQKSSRDFQLTLRGIDQLIPVSRTKAAEFLSFLKSME